ncbi:MAG: hypothetical protein C0489_06315 [Candidatus Accumulibacter sp.]|nr:hypothetical protein [Accumulibacter sp.]MBA4093688.1 hypothetical protein [Accumulibacter sp.]
MTLLFPPGTTRFPANRAEGLDDAGAAAADTYLTPPAGGVPETPPAHRAAPRRQTARRLQKKTRAEALFFLA